MKRREFRQSPIGDAVLVLVHLPWEIRSSILIGGNTMRRKIRMQLGNIAYMGTPWL